jgi:hypothetical protein
MFSLVSSVSNIKGYQIPMQFDGITNIYASLTGVTMGIIILNLFIYNYTKRRINDHNILVIFG